MSKEKLTWEQIKTRYPDQWVLVGELESTDDTLSVQAGVVLSSSHDQSKLLAGRERAGTLLYTGEEGMGNSRL